MTNIQLAARTSCARKGTATREVYELLNAYVAEHDVTIVHMSDILRSYIDDMSKAAATPVRFYDEAATVKIARGLGVSPEEFFEGISLPEEEEDDE